MDEPRTINGIVFSILNDFNSLISFNILKTRTINGIVFSILNDISELKSSVGVLEERLRMHAEVDSNVVRRLEESIKSVENHIKELNELISDSEKMLESFLLENKVVKREQKKFITLIATIVSLITGFIINILSWVFNG